MVVVVVMRVVAMTRLVVMGVVAMTTVAVTVRASWIMLLAHNR